MKEFEQKVEIITQSINVKRSETQKRIKSIDASA